MITVEELKHRLEVQHNYGHGIEEGEHWDEGARSIIALLGVLHPNKHLMFFSGMYTALHILMEADPDDQQTVDWNEAG